MRGYGEEIGEIKGTRYGEENYEVLFFGGGDCFLWGNGLVVLSKAILF